MLIKDATNNALFFACRDNTKLAADADQKAKKAFAVDEASLKFALIDRLEKVEMRLASGQNGLRGNSGTKTQLSAGPLGALCQGG